jgi:hexosaminidase
MPELTSQWTSTTATIVPVPVLVKLGVGTFTLTANTNIYVDSGTAETISIGQYLADKLNNSTGYPIQVVTEKGAKSKDQLYLTTNGGDPTLGEEGYDLIVAEDYITLVAYRPAGLFRGIQTIRQLLPASIERSAIQKGPWKIPAVVIRDYPRFGWRGVMLDVARHFFKVDEVKRIIDLMALYKMNRFHLHLTDDQGWRIMIDSWRKLATIGGRTQVGGGDGGYYTQTEYADIVAYAQNRYITVIPEIDLPGHTNAALASYAELNLDGIARELYTGIEVGFSTLSTRIEATNKFLEDVIREIAALTPGEYIHIGGDEAKSTSHDEYVRFIELIQGIVRSHGKQLIGWEEIAQAKLDPSSIVQYWTGALAESAAQQGVKLILSPASRTYIDMKYDADTSLGLTWAGYVDVEQAYSWEPTEVVSPVSENNILGIEAPLWSETLRTIQDIEYMTFPRLLGYAEIGWSQAKARNWDEYKVRLGTQGARLAALGVNFYRAPQISWQ